MRNPLKLSDFDFELPESAIAQFPVSPRDHSRLMVVGDSEFHDRHFYDLVDYLDPGDVIVLNDTRVINARLTAQRSTGGKIEVLLVDRQTDNEWFALIKPAKKVANRDVLHVSADLSVQVVQKNAVDSGDGSAPMHRVRLITELDWCDALDRAGQVPIPPYIRGGAADGNDSHTYQTVVAREPGAVAAPTAGLHFTDDLLNKLGAKGVSICAITLHVGYGTFKPIAVEDLNDHQMHLEHYYISEASASTINAAKRAGRRLVAVGTTVTRCLESAWVEGVVAGPGSTDLFLKPGSKTHVIDGLITNFHLPRSSLLVLVSALMGTERARHAYSAAISRGYRFYSYGDAMLLWVSR